MCPRPPKTKRVPWGVLQAVQPIQMQHASGVTASCASVPCISHFFYLTLLSAILSPYIVSFYCSVLYTALPLATLEARRRTRIHLSALANQSPPRLAIPPARGLQRSRAQYRDTRRIEQLVRLQKEEYQGLKRRYDDENDLSVSIQNIEHEFRAIKI